MKIKITLLYLFLLFWRSFPINCQFLTTLSSDKNFTQHTQTQINTTKNVNTLKQKLPIKRPNTYTTHKPIRYNKFTKSANLELLELELTFPNLLKVIQYYNIKHPRIVIAQAIQETGWFRSRVCRQYNNLFGLTNPETNEYFRFDHWSESVRAYYTTVQYRYKGGNYYKWLQEIGYAEDKLYIYRLKTIVDRYFPTK